MCMLEIFQTDHQHEGQRSRVLDDPQLLLRAAERETKVSQDHRHTRYGHSESVCMATYNVCNIISIVCCKV